VGINVIAMLTNNDLTVPNALETFEANKHAKTNCWGFKDIGIDTKDAVKLVGYMKSAGKMTFLEPLMEDEQSCIKAARMAVECDFDYVVGMTFNKKVYEILKANGVKYFPTCGRREGLPRMLYGTHREIIDDAKCLLQKEVDGVCLSSYRYADGDPEEMAIQFRSEITSPLIISGGINNYDRLGFVKKIKPWGFTIGSALFTHKFGKENSIAQQLDLVQDYMAK